MTLVTLALALAGDTPAPAPPAEAPPAEAPAEPSSRAKNANLTVTYTTVDGVAKKLVVTGIERSVDFFGDQGWSREASDLKLNVEVGKGEKGVPWTDVKSVSVTPGSVTDADCTYSSDYSPWMYECTLKTTVNVVLKDGSKGLVNNRHKWRFSTDDGTAVEFWLYKHTAREQDDPTEGGDNEEDMGMYTKLQDQLRTDLKSTLVKSITVM